MKSLFDEVSQQCSKVTTKAYSTSFSLGIYFLSKQIRNPIYAIYGFVRFADEIVDSFDGYEKKKLLQKFSAETYDAIQQGISLNPILNAFQHAVNRYKIDAELIRTFFKSMEMDLEKKAYSTHEYKQYILGSAEVVGLMCLHVFTDGNKLHYDELKPFAMKLGSAFQKVNFLRDLKSDHELLGRMYFPNIQIDRFSSNTKKQIEDDIEQDFAIALSGIKKLPSSSKGGVYLAYVYYKSLFNKIKNVPAQKILTERVRISNSEKFALMLNSILYYRMRLM